MSFPLLFSFILLLGPGSASRTAPPKEVAPAFRLLDVNGHAVALQDFRGRVVYVDFWFSACRPCLAEGPAAAQLKRRFLGKDVVFLYISIDVVMDAWRATIAKYELDSPNSVHLFDPEGWHAARAYKVQGFPTYFIIGRDGRIWQREAPRPSAGRATVRAIERALQEPTALN